MTNKCFVLVCELVTDKISIYCRDILVVNGWPSYLDLAHLLGADFIGMEAVRGELVGTQGDFAGEDVPEYYENGEHEIIEEYVRDELAAMAAIYEELRDSAFFEELMGIRRKVGFERELV